MADSTPRPARYPLRAVIRRTGLSADVIRAWERRYGAVAPRRSDGGHRLYSEEEVVRLTLLRRAVAEGHSIGEIAALEVSALETLSNPRRTETSRSERDAVSSVIAEAIAATESLDQGALEGVLKHAVLSLGATRFIDTVAADLLREVGDRWHAGALAPFHEHLASHTVRRVLGWVSDAYNPRPDAPAIIVATPAGERHELGALIVAAAAAEEGWRVVYLGADLPGADIAAAAVKVGASLVALSVVYANGPSVWGEVREAARALPDEATLVVGGAAAAQIDRAMIGGVAVEILGDLSSLRLHMRARRAGQIPRST